MENVENCEHSKPVSVECGVRVDAPIAWDIEANAMNTAILYMEVADDRAKERFIYHLSHRFFPEGRFEPHGNRLLKLDFDEIQKVASKMREP